ncbi:hypothetical protein PCPL58_3675 [Pseudomonas cerasi]|uniref:Uncharacterized protein n=1 Tax=Pseudomonas cerasi TaxID=1583341 RepID=A0A193SSG4_9PSED|nr:hypothetical protein PCPL58_3675 [Pseudomonas cerasi]SOS21852.1 hypothetical protein PL963_03765 [Pseudomonas cerasi]
MGQHDSVPSSVGQVKTAAQPVAKLVMQRHADVAQHRTTQPGAIQAITAGTDILRLSMEFFQVGGEHTNAFFGHQRHPRITILRLQAFSGVGDGIQPLVIDISSRS